MAWIESHQKLRYHYKTKRLARELKITVAAAVGHLHFLWWWAMDFAPDGDLTKFEDCEIADAIGYGGKDPSKAKAALISAGFLDSSDDGALTIHDWEDYTGRFLDKCKENREKERDRKAKQRKKKKENTEASLDSGVTSEHVLQDSTPCPEPVPPLSRGTQTGHERDMVKLSHGTMQDVPPLSHPYNTKHNITVPNLIPPLSPASGEMDEGAESESESNPNPNIGAEPSPASVSGDSQLFSDCPLLQEAFDTWLRYKHERREDLKPTGVKMLISRLRNNAEQYGPEIVSEVIRDSIANNYQGIVYDWIKQRYRNSGGRQPPHHTNAAGGYEYDPGDTSDSL